MALFSHLIDCAAQMTEQEIIKGCQANQAKAQKALYDTYARRVMGICTRYAKNHEEAEDIFQEAYIKVFKYIGEGKPITALTAWIKRVVVNTAINNYQKHKKHYNHANYDYVFESNFDYEEIVAKLSAQELMKIIYQLPRGYQMVFNLYEIEGYSHKEIAEMMNISVSTSKSQLSRAKVILKKQILAMSQQRSVEKIT